MKKKPKLKDLKDSGWYDFACWCINYKLTPDTIDALTLERWFTKQQTLKIIKKLEAKLYSIKSIKY